MTWQHLFLVIAGSGLGGGMRYLLSFLYQDAYRQFAPTLTVNLIGSFLIGLAYAISLKYAVQSNMSLFFMTGFLGGFTTFSSFSLETLRFIEAGNLGAAILYMMGSVGLGLALVFLGYYFGKLL